MDTDDDVDYSAQVSKAEIFEHVGPLATAVATEVEAAMTVQPREALAPAGSLQQLVERRG